MYSVEIYFRRSVTCRSFYSRKNALFEEVHDAVFCIVASVEGIICPLNATHTYGPPLRHLVPSFQSGGNVFKKKKKAGKHIEMQRK